MIPDNLNVLNYPITTPEAKKMWGSRHKCNKMKSIIAFSLDLSNANDNLRRYGYTLQWRKKAIANFGQYVNSPEMLAVPFSEMSTPWWVCMPFDVPVDPNVAIWMDAMNWIDLNTWDNPYNTMEDVCLNC